LRHRPRPSDHHLFAQSTRRLVAQPSLHSLLTQFSCWLRCVAWGASCGCIAWLPFDGGNPIRYSGGAFLGGGSPFGDGGDAFLVRRSAFRRRGSTLLCGGPFARGGFAGQ
ncbi:hypothetical protein, partial [Nonomuraea zeae]|uniref:hypothetical protein n=1 Tax=Nonomuraea zeae TaxID=1642303 RepID=UPI00198218B2